MLISHRAVATSVAVIAGLILLTPSARAADEGFSYSLFSGKNLDGWVVTGCDVAAEAGTLVLKGGNGFARTVNRYTDFVLEIDWRAAKTSDYDSGVYFRSELPTGKRQWPQQYQINLKQGDEGNVTTVKTAKSTGLIKPGEWNNFELRVVGHTAALKINGQPAWAVDVIEPLSGYVGLQSEVPLGGSFAFRNIRITELDHHAAYDGKTLTGWEPVGGSADAWKVEEGLLVCTGKGGSWLRNQKQVGDFNLRLDYRLLPGGNSGVYVRVPEDGNHHGDGAGLEVQILDDAAERYRDLQPYQYSGSLYGMVPAKPRVSKPAGEWNSLEINAKGPHYRVTHNGTVVIDIDGAQSAELSKRRTQGWWGLQNHSERVVFRNVRLGPAQD